MIQFFNTRTRKKEPLKTLEEGKIGIYTCGPTVYDFAHIGNFRAYVSQDILKRYLKYRGFEVKHIMNLTDVDDKTIKGSMKQGISLTQYTEKYSKAFFDDLHALGIQPADVYPKATEHIQEMVDMIETLKQKGIAYTADDNSTYYNVAKFDDYGLFAGIDKEGLKAGARVSSDEYDKQTAADFALWKSWDEDDGDVFWETSLGKGRPGWHIECSAMSMKYLGEEFDMHAGGIDLVFPHHQNEVAQSEAATGKTFAHTWVHNAHLIVDGKKMSKSLGNFFTLRDILDKGYDGISVRYLLMATHYRQQLNFTFEGLDAAKNAIERVNEVISKLKNVSSSDGESQETLVSRAKEDFERAMDDDLNISEALGTLFDFVRDINKALDDNAVSNEDAQKILSFLESLNSIFNVFDFSDQELSKEEQDLIDQREAARKSKDFAEADRLRDELKKRGIQLDDTDSGVRWKKL